LVLFVLVAAMMAPLMIELDNPAANYIEKQRVADVLLFFDEQLWLPLGAAFLLLAVHSLAVSHKIAGPLYRFRAVYKSVGEGDLAIRANIRKGDYLHADAKALNEMIGALETKIRKLEDLAQRLREESAKLKEAAGSGSIAEVRKVAERVESRVEAMGGQMAHFAKES